LEIKVDGKDQDIDTKGMSRVGLYKLFAARGYKVGCEVGVWEGRNAVNIFENIPGVKLFLVDPYINHAYVRKARTEERIVRAKARAHRGMKARNKKFIELMSEEAVKQFKDESLDFVYIDAEHTYNQAMLDIILWERKVKKGGIVSGHDYYSDPKHGVDVKSAVNDYVKANGIQPLYITDRIAEPHGRNAFASWFWVK